MTEEFNFNGTTTFINRPSNTVIRDFQNTYVANASDQSRDVLGRMEALVALLLESNDLDDADKEDALHTVHDAAEQIKEGRGSKLTLKGALSALRDLVAGAADIAKPAVEIVTAVLALLHL